MTSPRSRSSHRALKDLLLSLFTTEELRIFLLYHYDSTLLNSLPGQKATPTELANDAVTALERSGLVSRDLFEALIRERPQRKDDVLKVWKVWDRDLPHQSAGSSEGGEPPPRAGALHRGKWTWLLLVVSAVFLLFCFWTQRSEMPPPRVGKVPHEELRTGPVPVSVAPSPPGPTPQESPVPLQEPSPIASLAPPEEKPQIRNAPVEAGTTESPKPIQEQDGGQASAAAKPGTDQIDGDECDHKSRIHSIPQNSYKLPIVPNDQRLRIADVQTHDGILRVTLQKPEQERSLLLINVELAVLCVRDEHHSMGQLKTEATYKLPTSNLKPGELTSRSIQFEITKDATHTMLEVDTSDARTLRVDLAFTVSDPNGAPYIINKAVDTIQ